MGRVDILNSRIRGHDSKLFVAKHGEGKLCVFREGFRMETYILDGGQTLHVPRPSPHLVFALTDNWKLTGNSVEWGIEPIMKKIRDSDLWNRDIVGDLEKQELKREESNSRRLKHETEDFLYDFQPRFKKAFADVNVGGLAKKDLRRKKEKSERFKT